MKNLKIGTKLTISVVTSVAFVIIVSLVALINVNDLVTKSQATNESIVIPMSDLCNMSVAYDTITEYVRDLVLTKDEAEKSTIKSEINSSKTGVKTYADDYMKFIKNYNITSGDEYDNFMIFYNNMDSFFRTVDGIVDLATANDQEQAVASIKSKLNPIDVITGGAIDKLIDINVTQASDTANAALTQRTQVIIILAFTLLLSIVILLVLSFLIRRSIAVPMNKLLKVATDLSAGNLNVNKMEISKDEIGQLAESIFGVIDVFRNFGNEVKDYARSFKEGNIEKGMNNDLFLGDFKEISITFNDTMEECIDGTIQAINLADSFAKGNFDVEIPVFPGQRAVFTNTFENVKAIFLALDKDVNYLINAASEGNLKVRIKDEAYVGGWKTIVSGLNNLMTKVETPIQESLSVLQEMEKGNFEASMKGDYNGTFNIIKTSVNSTVENISSYIKEISAVLTKLAANNLDQNITREYVGEFSSIKEALNSIIDKLNNVISDISSAADQVAAGAKMISESSMTLAQGATEQASSVEELSATITVINQNTTENAQNAKEAEGLSASSKDSAIKGEQDMNNMLTSMDGIKESSNSISKIIKVIDDIAFQTNLLALNAAVEAARAGAHGKGFAVVAEEVRSLAGRSQTAAKETAVLIEESITRVDEGIKIADTTATALQTIVGDVTKVADIIINIAKASNEQAFAIGQVTDGVSQIAGVVQNNSSTSEETASAAEQLSSQAEVMRNLVGVFNLKRSCR